MAEFEVSIIFDERKCSNQEQFLYRRWIFNMILHVSAGCFYITYGKEISNTRRSFCKIGWSLKAVSIILRNFGNIFFSQ